MGFAGSHRAWLLGLLLGAAFGGCAGGDGGSMDTSGACPIGTHGCPCTAGGACDVGLQCANGFCVAGGPTTSGTDSGEGSTGAPTGVTGGSTDAGTGGEAGPLYPLAEGNRWTFTVTEPDRCFGHDTVDVTIGAEQLQHGEMAFELLLPCVEADPLQFWVRAGGYDRRHNWVDSYSVWGTILEEPVEEGFSWPLHPDYPGLSYQWTQVGAIDTPAGTFDDCWRRTGAAGGDYCRGIGPVAVYDMDGVIATLSSYELK